MDARHCAGAEMAELMAWGKLIAHGCEKSGAVGFGMCQITASYFGSEKGRG